jgi:putative phosphoribosyl transferase
MAFADRRTAGQALAQALASKHLEDPVVLALPRGGVPVAAEIARVLDAPLDLVLVRKIGVPYQPELAAAAVVDGGDAELVTNDDVVKLAGIGRDYLERAMRRELAEIERRRNAYLRDRPRVPLDGRTLILVDDGIATGASVRAALKALRRRKPKALILAVPVAPADTVEDLRGEVDDIVCLETPRPFMAIGLHYRDFHQLSDQDVLAILDAAGVGAARSEGAPPAPAGR